MDLFGLQIILNIIIFLIKIDFIDIKYNQTQVVNFFNFSVSRWLQAKPILDNLSNKLVVLYAKIILKRASKENP